MLSRPLGVTALFLAATLLVTSVLLGCGDEPKPLTRADVVGVYEAPVGSEGVLRLTFKPDGSLRWSITLTDGSGDSWTGSFDVRADQVELHVPGQSDASIGRLDGNRLIVTDPNGQTAEWTRKS
jgi:hypothetical protein